MWNSASQKILDNRMSMRNRLAVDATNIAKMHLAHRDKVGIMKKILDTRHTGSGA